MAESEVESKVVQQLEIIAGLLKDIRDDQHKMYALACSQHPHRYIRQVGYTWLAGGPFNEKISDEFMEEIDGKAPYFRSKSSL